MLRLVYLFVITAAIRRDTSFSLVQEKDGGSKTTCQCLCGTALQPLWNWVQNLWPTKPHDMILAIQLSGTNF
jgi:hypothetical protein